MKTKSAIRFIYLLLFIPACLHAQMGPVASGNTVSGTNGKISYSIGQFDYITAISSAGSFTQGLQQPFEFFIVGTDNYKGINLELSAYPNPASKVLNLKVDDQDYNELSFSLYDQQGQFLIGQDVISNITTIPMQDYPSAIYLLKVFKKTEEIKSFKIIKK